MNLEFRRFRLSPFTASLGELRDALDAERNAVDAKMKAEGEPFEHRAGESLNDALMRQAQAQSDRDPFASTKHTIQLDGVKYEWCDGADRWVMAEGEALKSAARHLKYSYTRSDMAEELATRAVESNATRADDPFSRYTNHVMQTFVETTDREDECPAPFEVGDTVGLRSGGPVMTVEALAPVSICGYGPGWDVYTIWIHDGVVIDGCFDSRVLTPYSATRG